VQRGAIVGSTAVVALLVRDRLVVANCGDSRAVLCRGAHAVPLSEDQKVHAPSCHVRTCTVRKFDPCSVDTVDADESLLLALTVR
jgi:serine/threonine protein phosphatase PrpC